MPKTQMKKVPPSVDVEAFRTELLVLIGKYTGNLEAQAMLAVAAYSVGQIIALQDQRTFTSQMVMDLVAKNIEEGNQAAIDNILNNTAGSA